MILFVVFSLLRRTSGAEDRGRSKKALRIVDAAIAALCADYAPIFDLREAARTLIRYHNESSSRVRLIEKVQKAVLETKSFEVAMAGHSVCAGHGNYFNQSYAAVADEAIRDAFLRAAGVKARVRNYGMGGASSLPLGWCAADTFGLAPDLVAWDFQMVDGKNWRLSEAFCRGIWSLPSQPLVLLLTRESSRLSMLDTYAASGMPAASMPPPNEAALSLRRASRKRRPMPHFLQDILFDPKSEEEKRRKFTTPDNAPGRTRWHPGWRVHRLFGAVLAVWLLTVLGDALKSIDDFQTHPQARLPTSSGCDRTWWWCSESPPHSCATTYEPKRGRDLHSIVSSSSSWPVVLAKGDPGLRADEFGLGYRDKKWTLRGDSSLGPIEIELKNVTVGNLILCQATTGWRRPLELGDIRSDLRVAVRNRDERVLKLSRTKHVENCYHARFRPSSSPSILSLNLTTPSPLKKVYLSHVIWG